MAAGAGQSSCCKACGVPTATIPSISFATGSETVSHTDFTLPGHAPIEWTRTYHSRLGAYDAAHHGANATVPAYLGARWVTPYTTRIDQAADGTLTYHGADGRSHTFPRLAGRSEEDPRQTGEQSHNAIEDLTLGRSDDRLLILMHGRDYVETFELCPAFWNNGQPRSRGRAVSYRLTAQRNATGHVTELQYRHPGGQLSDIISPNAHVATAIDAAGRIEELWLVENNQAVRMLADYAYETRADGSADMTAAKDENEAIWHYGYLGETHLLDRYTDRTDRAFFLKWMHPDGFDTALTPTNSAKARAYHERAGDGSFETTLIWNKHIRMTTIIDAHGAEMRYYCDVLGYPYRIVHPEVTAPDGSIYAHEEWLIRDQNKNVTMHVHPDGSVETYTYDARDNLIRHQGADASVVHFAYDEADNLTGIRDAMGKAWTRAYDGILLVEEIDPLGHVTRYAYDEDGQVVEITDAKGGKKKLAYDAAGQLTAYTDCSGKTSRWAYNERGRLAKATNAAGEATQYHYDKGQLSVIEHPDRTREHLEYDAEGRLLLHRDALQRETRYEYSEAGQISRRIDANRNILEYRWDRIGRLAELRNENARSHRKIFLVRPHDIVGTYANADGDYDMDRDPLYNGDYVPGVTEDGEGPGPLGGLYFYQCDHLGTPMALTDADGQVAWEANYKAWGEAKVTITKAASVAGLVNPIRFQGQYFDGETGLHYNRHRYYDPASGRYAQSDPVGLDGGINTYAYGFNQPTRYTDPSGLDPHSFNWRVFRCMGDCTAQTMKELRCNPAPGVSSLNEVQSGDKNIVGIGPMTLGPIVTTVDAPHNTITNTTMPGHMLHPGWVQRQVVFDGKATWVVNTGGGDGPYSTLNDIGAPIVWGGTSPTRLPRAVGTSSSASCACP